MRCSLLLVLLEILLLLFCYAAPQAEAQNARELRRETPRAFDRPNQRPIDTLPTKPPEPSPGQLSVPGGKAEIEKPQDDGGRPSLVVSRVRFVGNSIFSDVALGEIVAPFLGRPLAPRELQAMGVAVTQAYLKAGYITSGALIPNQRLDAGELEMRITEGRLGEISIEGLRHYRKRVLEKRLRHRLGSTLRMVDLEEALRLVESDPNIERLDAHLSATAERGRARLRLRVEESGPYWTTFGLDNHTTPSVGTLSGRIASGVTNLSGFGDRVSADATLTEGLWAFGLLYEIPVHPSGTTFGLATRLSEADVVQPPFDELDIASRSRSYSARLQQPILRSADHRLSVGLVAEHREGRTSLLGDGFSFTPGADEGDIRFSVLRPFIEGTIRVEDFAIAVRSSFSFGLDVPSSTRARGDIPDGRFFSWLAQIRGAYRHPDSQFELHARLDLQLTDQPLLPLEQFAVGGPGSVRGYRRNAVVRDQGYFTSLEARYPLWTGKGGRRLLEISPFVDVGYGWNAREVKRRDQSLAGIGVGLRSNPVPPIFLAIEWGIPLIDQRGGDSLHGRGFLLSAQWRFQ